MITVYVLLSEQDGARYVGMAKDVSKRLKEHNSGKNRYTKGHMPWKVVYFEVFENWEQARIREKYFKSAAGRRWLIQKDKQLYLEVTGSLPA